MVRGKKSSRFERGNVDGLAIYYACCAGYYDTRVDKKLRIVFSRLHENLPAGATHMFSIFVEDTGYQVTRYDERYVIEADDRAPFQQRERLLREGVLEKALHYFTNGRYIIGSPEEERNTHLVDLLTGWQKRETLGNLNLEGLHPVVQDEPSDGSRRWSVTIGSHRCLVGLVKDTPEPEFAILP